MLTLYIIVGGILLSLVCAMADTNTPRGYPKTPTIF